MATLTWLGSADPVAQVVTVTVTADDPTTSYVLTIGTATVSVLGSGTSAAQTASDLYDALAASTLPQFAEVTWTYPGSGAVVTGTAATAGIPFVATSSVSGGAGTIGAVTTTTTSAGPADWSTAANWDTNTVPVNGDAIILTQTNANPIRYGLLQSGVTLLSLNADSTFATSVGLPRYNSGLNSTSGTSTSYIEYRTRELTIGCTTLNIGQGQGSGCTMFLANFGTVQNTTTIYGAGTSSQQGEPTIQLRGTHASNAVTVLSGTVGWAFTSGQAGTLATLKLGYETQQQTDANVIIGAGSTLSSCTVTMNGGALQFSNNLSSLTMNAGLTTGYLTSTVGTCSVLGGAYRHQSSGTITTGTVGPTAVLDFSQDPRARTVTNVTVYGGGTLNDPYKTVTFTNPFSCPTGIGGRYGALLNIGQSISLQRS